MKGFLNQIADISKLTSALDVLSDLLRQGKSTDDDSFGEELLFNQVIKPGRSGDNIDAYLERVRRLPPSNQSHRTTARGLKELFRRLGVVVETSGVLELTDIGTILLRSWDESTTDEFKQHWRRVMWHTKVAGDQGESHPYRILLKLLDHRPGTSRSLCALALEAKNDSEEEFHRILNLRDLEDEDLIRASIGITKSNWDNAKKIFPSIAEQLGQVARNGNSLYLIDMDEPEDEFNSESPLTSHRITSFPRKTSPDSIAQWREPDMSDELDVTAWKSPAIAVQLRADRTMRHNQIVRRLAQHIVGVDSIWEDPIDLLVAVCELLLLFEVKTLDGTPGDEIRQVRSAVAQLQYYEYFSLPEELVCGTIRVEKIAAFEARPSNDHLSWLRDLGITPVWIDNGEVTTLSECALTISPYIRVRSI